MIKKYQLHFIYVVSFMDLFAVGLIFPLLYPHVRNLGANHFTVGLIGSTYSVLQVLSGPLIGSWSDIRGKQFVLISTLLISSVCYVLLGLTSSVFSIFVIRFILGIVKHTQTLCKAIIADLVPRKDHAKAYGQSAGYGMLGFVIGPLIGGHVSEIPDGFFYVCCLTSLLFLINIALALKLPNVQRKKNGREHYVSLISTCRREILAAVRGFTAINWQIYWDSFAIRFLFGLTVSIFFSSQSLFLREKYELSQRYIGYTISFLSVIGVVSGFMLGTVTEKFYKGDTSCLKRILHSFGILSVCFTGFYFAPNLHLYFVFLIPFSIASTILRIVSMELMLTKSRSDEKGVLSGASNSIMSIARSITPLSNGIVGDIFGENAVMISGLVPALAGIGLCTKLRKFVHIKSH